MNLLFLLLIIALIIILICIILYNGLKIDLRIQNKENFEFKIKASILKIPIFTKEYPDKIEIEEDKKNKENLEENLEKEIEDKSYAEKLNELKPILKDLLNSKTRINDFLQDILKSMDIKKITGHLKLGLNDYCETAKIIGWIWSINVIGNTLSKPLNLSAEPVFTEEIVEIELHTIFKLNLLNILIKGIFLIKDKKIRKLIKDILSYLKDSDKTITEN